MRFRRAEWDIPMPESLSAYWGAWNEPDSAAVPRHLDRAVTDDVEWSDPREAFRGKGELIRSVLQLRSTKPSYSFVIASEIDHHHGRLRYRWDMLSRGRVLMEGLDVVTLAPSGLIIRVDGFFGDPTPISGGPVAGR